MFIECHECTSVYPVCLVHISFLRDSYHSGFHIKIFFGVYQCLAYHLVLVSCDKFWIKFIASLVSTFNFGFMTKKKLHPEVKLHRVMVYRC